MKRDKFPAKEILKGASRVYSVREIQKKFKISKRTFYRVVNGEKVSTKTENLIRKYFVKNNKLSTAGYRFEQKEDIPLKQNGVFLTENYKIVYRRMQTLVRRALRKITPTKRKNARAAFFLFLFEVKDKSLKSSEVRASKSPMVKNLSDSLKDDGVLQDAFYWAFKNYKDSPLSKITLVRLIMVAGGKAYAGRSTRLGDEELERSDTSRGKIRGRNKVLQKSKRVHRLAIKHKR